MNDTDNVVSLIRKLFALANDKGATEAEATRALEKANELLVRHNLSADSVGPDKPRESVGEQPVTLGKQWGWRHSLMVVLAKHNLCSALRQSDNVIVIGRPTNIAVSREMFDWIAPQLERMAAAEHRRAFTFESSRTWKASFLRGAVVRIQQRLAAQRAAQSQPAVQNAQNSVTALVVRTDAEIAAYNAVHHPNIRKGRARTVTHSSSAYARGMVAGGNVSLGGKSLPTNRPTLGAGR